MAKPKTSKSSRPTARTNDKPVSARDLGATLGQTIRDAAPDIVKGLIDQATHGNTAPAKFLFDFAGLTSAAAPDQQEDCLAALLLKELARRPGQDEEGGTVQ